MAQDQLNIKISFRDGSPLAMKSALEAVGAVEVEEVQQRGMVGIATIFLGVLVVSELVSLVAKIVRMWSCGVLVDARGPKLLVEKNCDLPRGDVLVISPDGTQSKLHEPSDTDLNSLIKTIGLGRSKT